MTVESVTITRSTTARSKADGKILWKSNCSLKLMLVGFPSTAAAATRCRLRDGTLVCVGG